jgi:hypothetical protein
MRKIMKKLALVVVLLCSASSWAAKNPVPGEYTLNVHVASSRLIEGGWSRLTVVIDGKKYELQGNPTLALLAPGDYKGKLVKDEHKTPYDSYRVYEFLFPDMKTRQYHLVGATE